MSEDVKMVVICHLVAAAELNKPRDQRQVLSCKSNIDAALDERLHELVRKGQEETMGPKTAAEAMYLYAVLQSVAKAVSGEDKQIYHPLRVVVVEGKTVGQSMSNPAIALMVDPERLDDPYIRPDHFVTPTIH